MKNSHQPFKTLFSTALILITTVILLHCKPLSKEFFIAPDGNDQNTGTINRPLATLEGARNVIRAYKEKNQSLPEEGIKVNLREGVYSRDASFMLEEQDSGNVESPIVYQAYQGENVKINGGFNLQPENFEKIIDETVLNRIPSSARNQVLQLDLSQTEVPTLGSIQLSGMGYPEVIPPPELFFNGKAMTLARWPNEGYERVQKVIDPGTMPRAYQPDINPQSREYVPPEERDDPWKGFVIQYEGNRPNRWTQAEDAWMFGYFYWDWADGIVKIDKIDTLEKSIKSVQPSWYSIREDQRYYVFNLLEELDAPGEWYLDRSSETLYFYPPEDLANSTIQLSLLEEPLVRMENTSNVEIQGLTFEVSRGHGVQITGGKNNLISDCTLRRLGQKAVVIGNENFVAIDDSVDAGTNNGVTYCEIYDTGKGGIVVNGGDRRQLIPGENYATNNHIHNYSRIQKTYTEAVQVYGVGHRVAHNLIHDAPHAAIQFRGNDHLIEYNEIHHVNQEADDAGAIYTGRDWTYRGNVLRYNFIHHVGGVDGQVGVFGIYLDDAMSSVEAYGNVFYQVWRAFHIGGGRDHRITNNIIVEGTESIRYDARAYQPDWFAGTMDPESGTLYVNLRQIPYQEPPWSTKYPKLVNLLDGDPGVPSGSVIENNVIYKAPPMNLESIVRESSTIRNNLVIPPDQDPGFVDMTNMDFRLKEEAYVYKQLPEFEKIPFEEIGLENGSD